MQNVSLMAWDVDNLTWRRVVCNAAGKLIIDPSEILEDNPTDNEVGKAPTSNWAFDHKADASAHHARYTDAEAITAQSRCRIKLEAGTYTNTDLTGIGLVQLSPYSGNIYLKGFTGGYDGKFVYFEIINPNYQVYVYHNDQAVPGVNRIFTPSGNTVIFSKTSAKGFILIYHPDGWRMFDFPVVKPADLFLNNPTDGEVALGPTSNWAFDHKADASAHHTRYTDAEAKAAVGYNGTKYWSCPGIHFDPMTPSTEDITKTNEGSIVANATGIYLKAAVSLPHGATVTTCTVKGNASSGSNTWELYALKLSDRSRIQMAWDFINSASSSITQAVIDNSTYAYFLRLSSLAVADEIWGAEIKYTL